MLAQVATSVLSLISQMGVLVVLVVLVVLAQVGRLGRAGVAQVVLAQVLAQVVVPGGAVVRPQLLLHLGTYRLPTASASVGEWHHRWLQRSGVVHSNAHCFFRSNQCWTTLAF